MNILPDINCPHCGPVIVNPHTMYHNHSGHSGVSSESTLTFLQRIAARRGAPPRAQHAAGNVTDIAQPGTNPKYVRAAIRAELERLAAATEGSRNHTLHDVACNVVEFVKGAHANETKVRAELERIAAAIGLGQYEIQATLRSAWNRVGPRSVPAPAGVAPAYTIEAPAS
jgi:hypothetical protein